MERRHGPINSCSFAEGNLNREKQHSTSLDMDDKMPFLQMLQSVNEPPSAESISFQLLLMLQHQKTPWDDQVQVIHEPERCSSTPPLPPPVNRKKRKKSRPPTTKEEVESHRINHIAVERNRRLQMNNHLSELRSLTPPSYVQRGDQASIIGGAIDFIKELEQIVECLEAEKKPRNLEEEKIQEDMNGGEEISRRMGEFTAEIKSMAANVHATLIHNHVSLKIQCGKRHGQLLKVVSACEDLSLTVLHLNVTCLETSVHYSINLKIEDSCKLRSASEIAEGIHHIFMLINSDDHTII